MRSTSVKSLVLAVCLAASLIYAPTPATAAPSRPTTVAPTVRETEPPLLRIIKKLTARVFGVKNTSDVVLPTP